jgi:hypothetical protein
MDNRSKLTKAHISSKVGKCKITFLTILCITTLFVSLYRENMPLAQLPLTSHEVKAASRVQAIGTVLPTKDTSLAVTDTSTAITAAANKVPTNTAPVVTPPASAAPAKPATPPPAFLKTTGMIEAWKYLQRDVTALIAIVDTGVDFNHPKLKPYLLAGKNLIDDRKSPQDDNGHGTSVAGIIVTIANAGGGSGSGAVNWKGKLLPVKALDKTGSGDEVKLTQGIRYAVDQGADIIVLSLGLRRDAPGLRDAVTYAENKGVLLIAASGNDAAVFGAKAAVQYPAAYPSVLAVAGSDGTKPNKQSTSGPENDISAAWKVQTMALGGGTLESEGTSMGAPQVAAVAAMLMAQNPDWKPLDVREALRRTATNDGITAWNKQIGYGFLSADKAIQAELISDWHEPNDNKNQAAVFPLGKEVSGSWGSKEDREWFTFEAPYDGIYTLYGSDMTVSLYDNGGTIEPRSNPLKGTLKQWTVSKGRYWLLATGKGGSSAVGERYRLVSDFTMSQDSRESNDSAAQAFTLPARSQQWTGNFHQQGDEDWFVLTLPKTGSIRLTVSTDTTRIDPELWILPIGGSVTSIDKGGDGVTEEWLLKAAAAGKYYIRITNAVSSKPEAVIGTYTATLEYITEREDAFEPNEGPLTSTSLSSDKVYNSIMNTNNDQDWYRFTLTKKQTVKLSMGRSMDTNEFQVELQDKKLQILQEWTTRIGQKALFAEMTLEPGTYYVKITANKMIQNQAYGIRLKYTEG